MNFKLQKLILILIMALGLIIVGPAALAVPANNAMQELTQPSGEKFKATQHGDEWFNWVVSETGEVIVQDVDGFWKYGEITNSKLKASKTKYKIHKKPDKVLKNQEIIELKKQTKKDKVSSNILPDASSALKKDTGSQSASDSSHKILVLLVQFTDINMKYSENAWNNAFFGTTGSTVNNYYKEVSGGRFYFSPAQESYGTSNDGVIKVTLNYPHPNTGRNTGYANQKIVSDALTAANPYIDYSSFDTDGNGYISTNELHIVTTVAGYEAAYGGGLSPSIWAHRWSTSVTLDGKVLSAYTQQGEIHYNHMATIGVLCHELAHDLGLPDLYDYDGSSHGVGPHSLMAEGSWGLAGSSAVGNYAGSSPAHLDAWSKMKLGFTSPITVSAGGKYTVNSFGTNQYNILKIPTSNARQYFLVENRQFSGFDKSLATYVKNPGIAIWHIDEEVLKGWAPNNDEKHKGVDLEEANEGKLGYSQLDRRDGYYMYSLDHYYYSGGNTTFSPSSIPNSSLYDGTKTGITISSTGASSDSMTVNITLPDNGTTTISYNLSENANTSVKIYDSSSTLVKILENSTLKMLGFNSVPWDGRDSSGEIVDDGIYTYEITAADPVGLSSIPATGTIIVNRAPSITKVSDGPDPFKPDGTNASTIKYTLYKDADVSLKIYDSSDNVIKTLINGPVSAGTHSVAWDGKNQAGSIVYSDIYLYKFDAVDTDGKTAEQVTGTITVDLSPPSIYNAGISPDIFAPTGTNSAAVSYSLSESANTTVAIYNGSNVLVKTLESNKLKPRGSSTVTWDGTNSSGKIVADGTYIYKINAVDLVGFAAVPVTGSFTVKHSYPSITSVSDGPDPFAPDGSTYCTIKYTLSRDANVTIKVYDTNGSLVRTLVDEAVSAGTRTAKWYGSNDSGNLLDSGVYTYKIDAVDSLGRVADQVTGTITLDLIPPQISGVSVDPDPFEPIE